MLKYTDIFAALQSAKHAHETIKAISLLGNGLYIVSGKQKSGKTTLLNSLVGYIDLNYVVFSEIETIEDFKTVIEISKSKKVFTTINTNSILETFAKFEENNISKNEIIQNIRLIINTELIGKTCQLYESKYINEKEQDCAHCNIIKGISIYEILVFYSNIEETDNIYNFLNLVKENKCSYISKNETTKLYCETIRNKN